MASSETRVGKVWKVTFYKRETETCPNPLNILGYSLCGFTTRKVKQNLNMYPSAMNKCIKCHTRFRSVFWSIILRRFMFYNKHYLFGLSSISSVLCSLLILAPYSIYIYFFLKYILSNSFTEGLWAVNLLGLVCLKISLFYQQS